MAVAQLSCRLVHILSRNYQPYMWEPQASSGEASRTPHWYKSIGSSCTRACRCCVDNCHRSAWPWIFPVALTAVSIRMTYQETFQSTGHCAVVCQQTQRYSMFSTEIVSVWADSEDGIFRPSHAGRLRKPQATECERTDY
jgi:hypothetical protein